MSNFYKKFILAALTVLVSGVFISVQIVTASTFSVVEGVPYTVSKTILPADSSITLSSFNSPGGLAFTMSNFGSLGYATLDPNNLSRLETITFTGITNNGTSVTLTGVSRGIDFVSPYSASTTLAHIHLVGSSLILSNPGAFYGQQFALLNAASTIGAVWTFASTTMPMYDSEPSASMWAGANGGSFVSLNKLNATTIAGAANAGETQNGISQLATGLQMASSTALGSSGGRLVLSASYATSTPFAGATTTIPVTQTNGKLNQGFFDLTQPFIVTGQWTFNTAGFLSNASSTHTATTTIAASSVTNNALVLNTLPYKFPSTRASSSTVLAENGSGGLSWEPAPGAKYTFSHVGAITTSSNSFSTTTAGTIPGGFVNASSTIMVDVPVTSCNDGSGSGTCTLYVSDDATGKILASADIGSANSNDSGGAFYHATIVFNNSVSSEAGISTSICFAAGTPVTSGCSGGARTSTVNFSNDVTLDIVTRSTTNTTSSVSGYTVVVSR